MKPIAAEEPQHHGLHPGEATHQFNEHGALELIPGVSLSDEGPTYEERLRDSVAERMLAVFCDVATALNIADAFMAERARRYAKGN